MIKAAAQRRERRASQLLALGELAIRSAREDDMHTIAIAGELDLSNVERVRRELERVETTDVSSIVLDLSGLTFMDSSGVRLAMMAAAWSRADGNRLVLLRGRPAVQRVFELCAAERLLPFADEA